ncbi:hypothetical protein [Nodularia spumigena]|uniref:Uncharacterized protein n=1 Tax=Nodularia spumigena UHCC 0060 TaxID=3110300 RepID=A0ABU5UKZ3_NODSP|nr:hypothetical protein [Nodularia spumigena]MEA5525828.1 hypothetical protein [Nodularia spumigena UHCC 0143]MEA5606932.1 hypothetical protein [Nodularia spumigena UHCC 0060]MEA5614427.1 hypothetical protein [Nodularia spumigena UHCC 0040]
MPRFLRLIIIIVFLSTFLLISQPTWAQDWRPVRGGFFFGISGIALVEQQNDTLEFLIVHDNKQKNQGRLAIISIEGKKQPEYFPIDWPTDTALPIDLEAITSVPGKNNTEFIALTSFGKAYYLQLDTTKKTVEIIQEFNLPAVPQESNFEGFGLQNIDNQLVAMWGHRGGGKQPGIMYWGTFDLTKYQITVAGSRELQVPFPSENVRHISDIKIDPTGVVYITSASDVGDDGPFESAVYIAGFLGFNGNKILWRQNAEFTPLHRSNYRKIEGIELVPGAKGGVVLGTDDENLGSYVYIMGRN